MTGQRFGRWTVLDDYKLTAKGEKKWLCRCDCGTERYVLERSLSCGGSQSCGCFARERAKEVTCHSLAGQTFGELTVLQIADEKDRKPTGSIRWLCRCSCGNEYVVAGTLLVTGRRTSCPDYQKHPRNFASIDIGGRKYNRLTALYPTKKRCKKGSVVWHCRCDCGNELDVSYNDLVYSNRRSCGCQKKEHDQELREGLTHVAGTCIDIISSKKKPINNVTGCRGVYLIKGKYVAKIVFQKKQYYLGSFYDYEDAVRARKDAEALLFDGTAEFYAAWQAYAEKDPDWAEQNPVQLMVSQNADRQLSVTFLPVLPRE